MGAQAPSSQTLPLQSAPLSHAANAGHRTGHTAPQSASGSPPFFTPSEHVGAAHCPSPQTPDWQSAAAPHVAPSGHGVHGPPQSASDSPPFFTPSAQPGAAQACFSQMPLSHSWSWLHATHWPPPSQTLPPAVQGVPGGWLSRPHWPP